ncbi:MAG: hypothetical protein EB127_24305, partial [Alphaproteobacteria bacterium]|nr:hypothetical protein [Alphaproteobacteria bacterium]
KLTSKIITDINTIYDSVLGPPQNKEGLFATISGPYMGASAAQGFNKIVTDPTYGKYVLGSNAKNQLVLTNEILGRYIRVRPSTTKGDGFMSLSQIFVYDLLGLNISSGRPVYATSSNARTAPASSVVDGTSQPRKYPDFWHSNNPDRENDYIEIDLGSEQYITGIRIIGIESCPRTLGNCYDRMLELRIEINKETSDAAKEKYATVRNYISLCGSSNASNSITLLRPDNNILIERIDPSLPDGYTRYWNKKCRNYLYHNSQHDIVEHPVQLKERPYTGIVKRIPKIKVPTPAYASKLLTRPPIMAGGAAPVRRYLSGYELLTSLPNGTGATNFIQWLDAADPMNNGGTIDQQTQDGQRAMNPIYDKSGKGLNMEAATGSVFWIQYIDTSTYSPSYVDRPTYNMKAFDFKKELGCTLRSQTDVKLSGNISLYIVGLNPPVATGGVANYHGPIWQHWTGYYPNDDRNPVIRVWQSGEGFNSFGRDASNQECIKDKIKTTECSDTKYKPYIWSIRMFQDDKKAFFNIRQYIMGENGFMTLEQ